MSIDVEIFKVATKIIDDESFKQVDVERVDDDLLVSLRQTFDADRTVDRLELLRLAGFTQIDSIVGYLKAQTIWTYESYQFQVTALCNKSGSITLKVEWLVENGHAPGLQDRLRFMNRVFNTFRTKMEDTKCA